MSGSDSEYINLYLYDLESYTYPSSVGAGGSHITRYQYLDRGFFGGECR